MQSIWNMLSCLLTGFVFLSASAWGQDFPKRAVRVVVSSNAGGLQDQLARGVTQGLRAVWNEGVIIDNRPGVGAIPAADAVARLPADGHAILMTDSSTLMANMVLRKGKIPYDIEKDFAPVIVLVSAANILVANPKFPANNLEGLIALVRGKPDAYNYGSFGIGSVPHIDMEAIASLAGVKMVHIPFTGGAPLAVAMMSDTIQFGINGMTSSIAFIRSGRLKPIAYGGLTRSALLPDVPTISESGFPGFDSVTWFAWFVRAGTPQNVIDKIAAETNKIISAPAFVSKFVTPFGNELVNAPGSKLLEMFAADKKVFEARVKPLNIKLD